MSPTPEATVVRANEVDRASKRIGPYSLLQIGEVMEGTCPSPVHEGPGWGVKETQILLVKVR